jgi:hypothetical protein
MGHLINVRTLVGRERVDDALHLEIHDELRRQLEELNAFEYWEDVVVTTPSSINTDFLVETLYLKRTPSYYLIMKKDKAVDVYTGDVTWGENKLWLKATVATATITVRVVG